MGRMKDYVIEERNRWAESRRNLRMSEVYPHKQPHIAPITITDDIDELSQIALYYAQRLNIDDI